MSLLKVEKVSKRFGGIQALKEVSLEIKEGKIYGLIGPNGSGKTTLFKVIMGLLKPDGGKILFKEEDITGLPPYKICRKGIACTFQLTSIFPYMSVYENVKVGILGRGKKIGDADDTILNLLEFVGLEGKRFLPARNLTLAERKRLDLARALALSPQLLLLDEFMAGLNPYEVERALDMLREVAKQGITLILVEHIMKAIMSICDHIFVLNFGEKIAEGKPQEISSDQKVIEVYLGRKVM